MYSVNILQKKKKVNIIGWVMDKHVENLDDYGSPKVQIFVDESRWTCSSYASTHKIILHCANRKFW